MWYLTVIDHLSVAYRIQGILEDGLRKKIEQHVGVDVQMNVAGEVGGRASTQMNDILPKNLVKLKP